ncbi:MAG TPA: hypothetical protein VN260_02390 [Dissulfurispiraceae bacterium]|nr:hypothetical protein [Dissulfurispiraceae bacterium]
MNNPSEFFEAWTKAQKEFLEKWPGTQKDFFEKWVEASKNLQFMEKGSDFFEAWMKTQKDFIENWSKSQKDFFDKWMEATKNFQQALVDASGAKEGSEVFKLYNSWITTMVNSSKVFTDEIVNIQETWKNTIEKQMEMNRDIAKDFFNFFKTGKTS